MSMTGSGAGSNAESLAAQPDLPEQDTNPPRSHEDSQGADGLYEP